MAVLMGIGSAMAPAGTAGALKPGQARGTLRVNGEAVKLTHAYLTVDSSNRVVVTVANAPLTPDYRNQSLMFEKADPVKQGTLYLMNIAVSDGKDVSSCEIYHRALPGPFKRTNITGVHTLEATVTARSAVGRSYMKAPWKDGETEIFYDVSFNAAP